MPPGPSMSAPQVRFFRVEGFGDLFEFLHAARIRAGGGEVWGCRS